MNARYLLAAVVAALIALSIAMTSYMAVRDYRHSVDKVVADAKELTDSVAHQTGTTVGKANLVLNLLTNDFPLLHQSITVRQVYGAKLSKIAAVNKDIEIVAILDSGGIPVGSLPDAVTQGLQLLQTADFEHHRDHDDGLTRAGLPLSHPVTQRSILPLSKRINGLRGEFLGVAVVGISLDYIQDQFARFRRGGDSRILLVDKDGTIFARHPRATGPVGGNAHTARSPLASYIDRHESGHVDAPSPFDGKVRRYNFRHIEASPLIVVFGETTDEQLGAWRSRTHWRVGFLAMVIATMLAAAFYIDRLIRRGQTVHQDLKEALAKASTLEYAIHCHAMVSRTDIHDRIVSANETFCARSGYSLEEIAGKTHRVMNSGEHPQEFFRDLHETIKAGKVWAGDICNKTKGGDLFWSRTTIVPFRNAAGEIYQFVALRTDISELKFMQQQIEITNNVLSSSFDLLYATINSSSSGIVTTDNRGIIMMMNSAAEQLLGYDQMEAEGVLSMLDILTPPQRLEVLHAAAELEGEVAEVDYSILATATSASPEREWEYITKDSQLLPVSLSVTPLRNRDGALQGYVTSFNDLTRLKQVEVMKSDFVSMVSHELRTPLTSIKGALAILDKTAGSSLPDNQRKLLCIGLDNCEHLVRLVSDILDFEKISRNQMQFDMATHDAGALVEKAVLDTQPFATQFGVTYRLEMDEHKIPVHADPQRFIQVMVNLLSNAAKFSQPESEVLVSAHAENGMVTVAVTDRGIGIPVEFQPKIFQKFSQANHGNRPAKVKGTGLGLSIAKMMVEAQGGTIGFNSSPGVGTTFFIRFPLLDNQRGTRLEAGRTH